MSLIELKSAWMSVKEPKWSQRSQNKSEGPRMDFNDLKSS